MLDPQSASRPRLDLGTAAWLGLTGLLALVATLGLLAPREALEWQPALALRQPWRWFSAAAVHYSAAHLGVNLLGAVLVAALGWAARVPAAMALAWALAWPLTHLMLLWQPELTHYGGLSGVLHASVAVVAVHLVHDGTSAQRLVGAAMAVSLAAKVAGEAPWWPPVHHAELGITVASLAHATGALAGVACALLCGAVAAAWPRPGSSGAV